MNKTAKRWLLITLIVLIVCGICGTILSAIQWHDGFARTAATAEIAFFFDTVTEGIAPNGHRFSMDGIMTDEVLSRALEAADMSDRYTVEAVRDQIVITGIYPEDIVDQMMNYESVLDFNASRSITVSRYYPSHYSVSLYNDFDKTISQNDLEKLLQNIMDSFCQYFEKEYSYTIGKIKTGYDLDDFDYPQQLIILTELMQEGIAYSQEMFEKEPNLRYNGLSFSDVSVRLSSMIDNDISNLSAKIVINALTKNLDRILTQYQYEIKNLNYELEREKKRLERLDKLLASYEKNEVLYISTSDSLTKIDGNSSETYDKLVANRKAVADGITDLIIQINDYQMMLDDLMNNPESRIPDTSDNIASASDEVTDDSQEIEISVEQLMSVEEIAEAAAKLEELRADQISALEREIEDIDTKRVNIMSDFESMLNLYNETWINDNTVRVVKYDYSTPKILSGAFVKDVIRTAGPLCALGFIICMCGMIISQRKEEKQGI